MPLINKVYEYAGYEKTRELLLRNRNYPMTSAHAKEILYILVPEEDAMVYIITAKRIRWLPLHNLQTSTYMHLRKVAQHLTEHPKSVHLRACG